MLAKNILKKHQGDLLRAPVLAGLTASSQRTLYTKPFFYDALMLTDAQKKLREEAERFAQEEIAPLDEKMDKENYFPVELYKKLGDMGYNGMTVDKEYGGRGLGYFEHCLVSEEIAKASASAGMSYVTHSNLCANQIRLNGTEEQKRKYLPDLLAGNKVGALVMSEREAGSDVVSMQLKIEEKGDKYVFNGGKYFATNGPIASTFIIYGKTDLAAGHKGMSAFIVEKGTPGFKQTPKNDKLGHRGLEQCELIFENCEVPKENMLGPKNKGVYVLFTGLDYERLVLSALPIGVMQSCFDHSLAYATKRKQFGKAIGEFQITQAKIADMYCKLQTSRNYVYNIAAQFDTGKTFNVDSSAIYLVASRYCTEVALEALQIFGGKGYLNEGPVGRLLRDATVYDIAGGTKEIRQWIIGRELVKIFGE